MASISMQNLNKIYDNKVQAVFDFNLDVAHGEFIVLVGPSGCGKSTTLRMLAGLEDISTGSLLIDGNDVTNAPAKKRDIAMVFQNYALYAHMTIYENMAFSLMLSKEDEDVIHEKVLAAAEILNLTSQLGKKPKQLSGGQRQRVAVGRSIVRNPKVFLFDEPLSNLDAKLRGSMRRELKLLHKRLGATIVYVTHDQIEALTLADRIVVMSDGKVQQIGRPAELYDHPANLFVASFIGLPPMNFIEAKVTDRGLLIRDMIIPPPVWAKQTLGSYSGKEVIVGIRPEDIVPHNGDNAVPLKIVVNEHLGQNTLLHGMLAGKRVTAKFLKWCDYKQGDMVNVAFLSDKVHIFDKDTSLSIKSQERSWQAV